MPTVFKYSSGKSRGLASSRIDVVTAPYHVDEDTIGVLGVIGPTRMAYDRVVPIVDVTAKLLESALSHNS